MTDQAKAPPPLPSAKKPARFKKTRIALFTVGILWLSFRALSHLDLSALGSPDLTVRLDYSNVVMVTNTGSKPVTIKGVTVNDRPDCKAWTNEVGGTVVKGGAMSPDLRVGAERKFVPKELKVGDHLMVLIDGCNVVRAEVETDQGSGTYTFDK